MDNYFKRSPISEDSSPLLSILKIAGISLAGLFIFQFASLLILLPFASGGLTGIMSILENPLIHPESKTILLIMQGLSAFGGFILASWIYLKYIERKEIKILNTSNRVSIATIFFLLAAFFSFMLFDASIIDWNEHIQLPSFLAGFERWAQAKENELKVLTEFITKFDSFGQFLLGFLVIAIIPAIGEELLFRGLIQNKLLALTKNIHVAIWLCGFLFSVIHFQFYGLVPRMLLGVLFGYIYYWSGNLLLAMLGHFINNGLGVTVMYLTQLKILPFHKNFDTPRVGFLDPAVIGGFISFCIAFYLFWKEQRKKAIS